MPELLAQALMHDPRVAEAKRMLLASIADQQKRITGIRPPVDALKASYAETLRQFGEIRGGSLYYPYLGSGIGRGPLVELADGSIKYDFISGIGVHYLGHSHPALIEASIDAALQDTVMQGNLQQNLEAMEVSQALLKLATRNGAALKHCFLSTSGAMANENALKLALNKKSPASRILAFEHTFSGRTLALSQITDKPAYRVGLPTTLTVDYVPFFDLNHPEESTKAAVAVMKSHLARYPKQHAAFWFELVLGEGGYYPGSREFFSALCETARAAGVAVCMDEIQTFGRTTEPFGFQHFGLDRFVDLATVGKLTQICATMFTDEYKPPVGLVSQTFTGSTSSLFAARTILDLLARGTFFGPQGRIARLHERFVGRLKEIGLRHADWVRGPFGIGGMVAFTPLDGTEPAVKKFLQLLYEAGVIGFIAGSNPYRARFLMPVGAVADEDIDAVCAVIERVLEQAVRAS